jgi:predicted aspartyl protease
MTTSRHIAGALALLLPILSQAAGDAGSCKYVPVTKLALDIRKGSHHPFVAGSINGVPARMMVSTGYTRTFLMRAGAERLKLPLDLSGKYSYGLGGASVTYLAHIDDIALGDFHTGRMVAPVMGNAAMNDLKPVNDRYDATVGADYLLQTDMELSVADKTMRFFRASGCGDTFLAYWDSKAMEIPFIAKPDKTNRPYVEVELNGVKLKAILSTGATFSMVTRHAAELAGVQVDAPGVRKAGRISSVGDQLMDRWIADFRSFRIGDETVNNPRLSIVDEAPQGQGRIDMVLGMDFLRTHRVLFAMSQDRLYMSYLGGQLFGAKQHADDAGPPTP